MVSVALKGPNVVVRAHHSLACASVATFAADAKESHTANTAAPLPDIMALHTPGCSCSHSRTVRIPGFSRSLAFAILFSNGTLIAYSTDSAASASFAEIGWGSSSSFLYDSAVETPPSGFTSTRKSFIGLSVRTRFSPMPS